MHLTPANGMDSLRSTNVIAAQVILNVGSQNKDDSMTQKYYRGLPKWLPVVAVAIFAQLALAE